MTVRFLPAARQELADAVAWYDQQRDGLGDELLREFRLAVGRIQVFPRAWPALSVRTRRCRTSRFPYGVVYQIRDDGILVVAIMHLSRKPGYWQDRLDE